MSRPRARPSISHPIGLAGRCRATTRPIAANDTATAICGPAVTSGFCPAASASGIRATASTSTTLASAHAVAGRSSRSTGQPPLAVSQVPNSQVPNGRPQPFRERYDPSACTLRVNIPCATLAGLATMSGGTAGPGGSRPATRAEGGDG